MSLEQKITRAWYQNQRWVRLLLPLSKLYEIGLAHRKRKAISEPASLAVPIVVVGNITVGGTGKTPLIMHLCQKLSEQRLSVGIISRGYIRADLSSAQKSYPYQVNKNDSPDIVGDEPLMICQGSDVAVVVDPDRYAAAQHMLEVRDVDVILSDDGMQHFALPRDLEILVVDGSRELGNELLLPAGPLREPIERLRSVDFCLVNGAKDRPLKSEALKYAVDGYFQLTAACWVQVSTGQKRTLEQFASEYLASASGIKAVAGIGNPQRFFDTLAALGIEAESLPLDDHQAITAEFLSSKKSASLILMTAKDAVKCRAFATDNCWALEVGVDIDKSLEQALIESIKALVKTRVNNEHQYESQ